MSVTALSLANPNHVAQVASLLRSGQVIGLGLGGIYGLISSPLVGHAEKMNLVKNRPSNQPLTVLASHTHIFRWISRRQIGHPNLKTLLDTPEALSQIISQHPVHLRWKPATSRIPKHISPLLHDWGQAMQVLDLSMLGHIDNLLNHLPILAITSMNEPGVRFTALAAVQQHLL
jgi:tRNA A37 threonylcarbamoyladenosine synthetase subunit TsaC/SUA5/YrdC